MCQSLCFNKNCRPHPATLLTFSWRNSLPYTNQCIDLLSANQWNGFYKPRTSIMGELKMRLWGVFTWNLQNNPFLQSNPATSSVDKKRSRKIWLKPKVLRKESWFTIYYKPTTVAFVKSVFRTFSNIYDGAPCKNKNSIMIESSIRLWLW